MSVCVHVPSSACEELTQVNAWRWNDRDSSAPSSSITVAVRTCIALWVPTISILSSSTVLFKASVVFPVCAHRPVSVWVYDVVV